MGGEGGVALGDFLVHHWTLMDLQRVKMAVSRQDLAIRCYLWRQLAEDMQGILIGGVGGGGGGGGNTRDM